MKMKMKTGGAIALLAFFPAVYAATGPWDVDVADFPRQAGEAGDSARILRAVEAAGKGGVVWFPRGEYAIDAMLVVSNQCSLWLHKSAHLKAVKEMPFVLRYFGRMMDGSDPYSDHNLFIRGGDFDGNGLASCANLMGARHFTIADGTFRNGRKVGLQLGDANLPRSVQGGYEIIANNLYFVCKMPGLAGNVGFLTYIGDSHFTDLVVVDYTIGVSDRDCGSNRYTRCHVWGGPVRNASGACEYLPNSIAFDLRGWDALLEGCYADTAMTGFNVVRDSRIVACAYYNNWHFKMDNPVVFNHEGGSLLVSGGRFSKESTHSTLYRRSEKAGALVWRDNLSLKFTPGETKELEEKLSEKRK